MAVVAVLAPQSIGIVRNRILVKSAITLVLLVLAVATFGGKDRLETLSSATDDSCTLLVPLGLLGLVPLDIQNLSVGSKDCSLSFSRIMSCCPELVITVKLDNRQTHHHHQPSGSTGCPDHHSG